MHVAALLLFFVGLAAFGASSILPANEDLIGVFWAAHAVEAVTRGPRLVPDYPLFVIVTAANVLFLFAPVVFPFARSASARVLPVMLALAAGAALWARFSFRPGTWSIGYDLWCAALAAMAAALFVRSFARAPRARPLSLVQGTAAPPARPRKTVAR
jgi:hypothetical protein